MVVSKNMTTKDSTEMIKVLKQKMEACNDSMKRSWRSKGGVYCKHSSGKEGRRTW